MNDIKLKLGTKIRQLRKSDLHFTYISRIERGKQSPTIEVLSKIATALDVKVKELLNFSESPQEKQIYEIISLFKNFNSRDLTVMKDFIMSYHTNIKKIEK